MAYMVSVVIYYDDPELAIERSQGFTLETESPPTVDEIGQRVDEVALDLVSRRVGSPPPTGHEPTTYRFEVESVFEFT